MISGDDQKRTQTAKTVDCCKTLPFIRAYILPYALFTVVFKLAVRVFS